jgi:predicted DCC family thiol-disulfide oxidoreductase YuxK
LADMNQSEGVIFIYDGECPVCSIAAQALRIRAAAGPLRLVDARREKNHPVLLEINALGYDLDDSMILKYGGRFYRAGDALALMALLGSGQGWFNRMNALLFRSKTVAAVLYPVMRAARNLLIRLKGVPKIHNLADEMRKLPIFQPVFGANWSRLPPALKARYANRPYSNDLGTVEGHLDISVSPMMRILAPLLKWTGMLVPYHGKQVPVVVNFASYPHSEACHFHRTFHFPGRAPYVFRSSMTPEAGNVIVEDLNLGISWRATCDVEDNKVVLRHLGYVVRVLGWRVPVPLQLLFGTGYAEEEATGPASFRMKMEINHPLLGEVFAYRGHFEVKGVLIDP